MQQVSARKTRPPPPHEDDGDDGGDDGLDDAARITRRMKSGAPREGAQGEGGRERDSRMHSIVTPPGLPSAAIVSVSGEIIP